MSPTEATVENAVADVALLPKDLIGGDESIIFAIKPSMWFVVFDSANWAAATLLVIALSHWIAGAVPGLSELQLLTGMFGALAARVAIAILRWVSRFYVLTNRRVMRIRGVARPDVFECPLVNIRNTAVVAGFLESFPKLGTIRFVDSAPEGRTDHWINVASPHEVHAEIRKAIRRAKDCQPHL